MVSLEYILKLSSEKFLSEILEKNNDNSGGNFKKKVETSLDPFRSDFLGEWIISGTAPLISAVSFPRYLKNSSPNSSKKSTRDFS